MKRIVKQILKFLMVMMVFSIICYSFCFHKLFPAIFNGTSLLALSGIIIASVIAIVIFAHTRFEKIRQQVNSFLNDRNKKEIQEILLRLDNFIKETQEDSFLGIMGSLLILVLAVIKDVLPSPIPLGQFLVDVSGATYAIIFGLLVSILLSLMDLLIAYIKLLEISSYAPPH